MSRVDWYALSGPSMWPLGSPLQAGVVRVAPAELKVGDLIAFVGTRAGDVWLHRIVAITSETVVTRGDTRADRDAPVAFGAILGRVERLRCGGVVWPLPVRGWPAVGARALGRGWGLLAPGLRRAFRTMRRAIRRNS